MYEHYTPEVEKVSRSRLKPWCPDLVGRCITAEEVNDMLLLGEPLMRQHEVRGIIRRERV